MQDLFYMEPISSILLDGIRGCPSCGRFIFFDRRWVCQPCELKLQVAKTRCIRRDLLPTQVNARWAYGHEDEGMKNLLLSLKGLPPQWVFLQMVDLWIQAFPEEALNAQKAGAFIVPAPSARGVSSYSNRPRQHAQLLAQAFGQRLGLEVLPRLLKSISNDSTMQKFKDRERRQKSRQFEVLDPSDLIFLDNQMIIFVDDLVTTGATARAAFEALGCPKHFRIWALFDRSALIEVSSVDKVRQKLKEGQI